MISTERSGGQFPWRALASGMVAWVFSVSSGVADDGMAARPVQDPKPAKLRKSSKDGPGRGTLGYGPPGPHPGFQGFGLGFHPGYGYGGKALGVGSEGGYPYYGGPGYPHPGPRLQRSGGIAPFCYYGGPGYPTPDHPNFFGGVGPLVPDQPVVTFEKDPYMPPYESGYGEFNGSIPYPESTFVPSTTSAGESYNAVRSPASAGALIDTAPDSGSGNPTAPIAPAPAPGTTSGLPASDPHLGIEEESVVDAGGVRGLKVSKVYPQTPAEKAGLRVGDVIRSVNGYQTEQPGNLAWIIANAAPDNILKLSVRTAKDGEVRTLTAQRP